MTVRAFLILLPFVLLAGCAAPETPSADLLSRQEAACTTSIAAHVGRPPAEVRSRWLSEVGGVARVEARDGDRLHICNVDGSGRVMGYTHPRGE